MKKTLLFGLLALLLLPSFASADLSYGLVSYYDFDTNYSDILGVNDLAIVSGSPNSVTGKLGNAYNFNTGDSECFADTTPNGFDEQDTTISFWVQYDTIGNSNPVHYGDVGTNNFEGYRFTTDGSNKVIFQVIETTTSATQADANSGSSLGTWIHVVGVINDSANTVYLWVDGVKQTDTGTITSVEYGSDDFKVGCARSTTARVAFFDGRVDELGVWNRSLTANEIAELYNSGDGLPYENFTGGGSPPATPTASERYEQLAEVEQEIDVTVTSTTYTTITSDTVNISDAAKVYAVATVNLNPSQDNTAYCRLTLDGAEFNSSESYRSVTAGNNGNLIFTSGTEDLSAGSYNFGLECRKASGNPTYTIDVFNSTIYYHILTSAGGDELQYANIELNDATATTSNAVLGSTNITLSDNVTETGTTRVLVVDYAARLDYESSASIYNTIDVIPYINGSACAKMWRAKESGTSGTVGGSCYLDVGNETNSTEINISIYGQVSVGTNPINVTNAFFHVKEFIMNSDEIANDSYVGGASYYNLSTQEEYLSVDINTSRHASANIFSNAFFAASSVGGTAEGSFFLTNTTKNSATISRKFNPNQIGVIFVQEEFSGTSGTDTVNLNATCSPACYVGSANLLAYLVDAVAATPNSFEITANNVYGGTISAFSVNLSDGRTFSTTSGTIEVPATDGSVFNVTAQENSGAAIPYFANYTLNFNTTGDLALNLTPYTIINVSGNATINNFTVNGTSTTNGKVYLRLFNDSYNLSLTDATDDNGAEYANTNATVTASPYLEYYTFVPKYSNTINISFYDEETGVLIDFTTVYLEAISDSQAGNYSSATGTITESFLLPDTYTLRYTALGYADSFYYLTIEDRSFNALNLTMLNLTSAANVTLNVFDTLGNKLEGAIVKILKFDVFTNTYNVVEILQTNFEGVAIANIVLNSEYYKFIIDYDGETRLTTNPTYIYGTELTFYVPITSSGMEDFFEEADLSGTITYNYNSNLATFTYSDLDNSATKGCFYAYTRSGDTNTLANSSCSSSSSGTLYLYAYNTSNTWVFQGVVTKGGKDYKISSYRVDFETKLNETGSGAFFAFIVLAVVVFIGLFSLEVAIVLGSLVPLLFTITKLANFDYVYTIPIFVLGLITAFIIGSNKK